MVIKVSVEDCIGCGVCEQFCPESFKLDDSAGKTVVISAEADSIYPETVKKAVESCPVSAIMIE